MHKYYGILTGKYTLQFQELFLYTTVSSIWLKPVRMEKIQETEIVHMFKANTTVSMKLDLKISI